MRTALGRFFRDLAEVVDPLGERAAKKSAEISDMLDDLKAALSNHPDRGVRSLADSVEDIQDRETELYMLARGSVVRATRPRKGLVYFRTVPR